jgi:hypothetical protein
MPIRLGAWLEGSRVVEFTQGKEIVEFEAQIEKERGHPLIGGQRGKARRSGGYCFSASLYWVKRHIKTRGDAHYGKKSEKDQLRYVDAKLWEKRDKVIRNQDRIQVSVDSRNREREGEKLKARVWAKEVREFDERKTNFNAIQNIGNLAMGARHYEDVLEEAELDDREAELKRKGQAIVGAMQDIGARGTVRVGDVDMLIEEVELARTYKLNVVGAWDGHRNDGDIGAAVKSHL